LLNGYVDATLGPVRRSEGSKWRDLVLGWRFQFQLDPLVVRAEGPLAEGFRQSVVLLPFDGSLRVAEVRIFPDGDRQKVETARDAGDTRVHLGLWSESADALNPERPEIDSALLRRVHTQDIVRAVREQWSKDAGRADRTEWEELLGAEPSEIAQEFVRSVDIERSSVGRPRSRGRERRDLELAIVAALYADAVGRGSRSPNKDVAEYLGEGWGPDSVRDAKFKAAEKGFLSGTKARQAAGVLTRKAAVILEEASTQPPPRRRGATKASPFTSNTLGKAKS
jgi:hypothetical protein